MFQWYATSDAFINSWMQKLVLDIWFIPLGKIVKTIVSLQIYVKFNNKEPKTACIWLFRAHSKTNEPKQIETHFLSW